MTKYMKKIIAALSLGMCLVTPALAWDTAAMNKQIDETNFLLDNQCSATLIDSKGSLLTAAHCIINNYQTVEKEVIDEEGHVKTEKFQVAVPGVAAQQFYVGSAVSQTNSYVYKVIKSDRALDLALIRIQNPPAGAPANLACTDVGRGDSVYAVGNSYAVLYSTVTKGIVSSVNRSYRDLRIVGALGATTDDGEHGLTQHSAVIAGGNSGGAMYTEDGKLAGVNVRGAATGFSFAVPLKDVRDFLGSDLESPCG